ncbi:hypothetical protein GCM10025857_25560 [Alicyclobacillus contaminans]|nr:hypothetical protein GCM10025857_25560 [Alicyclobacillus contaminans]
MDMDQTESPPIELPAQDYEAALAYHTRDRSYQVVTDAAGTRQLVVLVPVGPPDLPSGVVQVTMPVRSLQHMLVQQLLIFVVLAAVAVVAAVVTLLPTVRRTLVPLARVVHSASRVNAGNLDERVTVAGAQTEVATLAKSFNDMLDRLQQAFEAERAAKEKMRTFVADASHELRTPLTSIHGFLEVLLRGAAKQPEQLERALKSMLGESQRLTKLVQDLLTLARLDQTPGLLRAPCDLADILRDMQPQLALLAGEREVALELPASAAVLGDKDKLKQVVLNLFQNAVQHTSAETGRIAIVLRDEDTGIRLEVKDNGEGIPPDRMAHIFERFYRVDSARSRKHGGAGLGLSISQAIVQAHGGTIACESAVGEGTVFTVWLPKQASA